MDKKNMAYTCNGVIMQPLKREEEKKKEEILLHARIWMNIEDIMLSEINHKKEILYDFTHMKYLK